MSSSRLSILTIVVVGALFTCLLIYLQSSNQTSPAKNLTVAEVNAEQLAEKINADLAAVQDSLVSLSYNSFWQNTPATEWNFWLESQKKLYAAAGLSLLGVHALSNDILYFDNPSLPGQHADLSKPIARLYETKSTVSLLREFKGKPSILILVPLKNIENKLIGALIGVQLFDVDSLKKYHNSVKVPVAIIADNKIQSISIDTSPDISNYQTVPVMWPKTIKSALWQMVLLVEQPPLLSMTLFYGAVGTILTFLLLFVIIKQLSHSQQSIRLLSDTIDIQLPIAEQIDRLVTLQNLSKDNNMVNAIQAIRSRIEQLQQQKKSANLEVRRLQETEANMKLNISSVISQRDTAVAAPRLKSEFLSRMGDEITTPMKSVISMLKLLSEYEFDAEPKQLLNIAKRSTRTLVDNLNNILDFSKLDANMLKLSPKPTSVRQLVDDLASELSHYANDKGLSLQASTDPDVPTEVIADVARIKQILRNLLGNAIRFTKSGEISLYADIINVDSKQMLRFTVKDSGVGINQDAQKGLFDSLHQATKLTNSSFAGRLRLIVSRQLSELMGGETGLYSEIGKGSQFWFTVAIDND